MSRAVLHVDMDAFYASVEVRDRPELRGKPVAVGGSPEGRGVVAAASYEARRFGIHSAMPSATAKRLCPGLVMLPPRHDYYAGISQQIHAVFQRYTPLVEPLALDEAFLDATGSLRLFGSAEAIGRRIKVDIRNELQLVASVGVAPNKFLAKLASDRDKPDGFVAVREEKIQEFLDPMPVTRLWGVGKVTARVFERLGIRTIAQLRSYSPALLRQHFGAANADHLWALAHGCDQRPVVPEQEAKSISNETTFARDIADGAVQLTWLRELTEQVAWRLRRNGLRGRTVQLKVRFADFSTLTRSHTLPQVTDITSEIWHTVRELYQTRLPPQRLPVRLLGVGVSGFEGPASAQSDLFAPTARVRQSRLDEVVDGLRDRFGAKAIRRGKPPR